MDDSGREGDELKMQRTFCGDAVQREFCQGSLTVLNNFNGRDLLGIKM